MNITHPKPITIKVVRMGDYADECQRIWNEQAERERSKDLEIAKLADHYFQSGFTFGDFIEAMDACDQENRNRIMELMRSDDMAEFGLQVKNVVQAYAWRFAEGEI